MERGLRGSATRPPLRLRRCRSAHGTRAAALASSCRRARSRAACRRPCRCGARCATSRAARRHDARSLLRNAVAAREGADAATDDVLPLRAQRRALRAPLLWPRAATEPTSAASRAALRRPARHWPLRRPRSGTQDGAHPHGWAGSSWVRAPGYSRPLPASTARHGRNRGRSFDAREHTTARDVSRPSACRPALSLLRSPEGTP